jgi:ABC-type glycerol-3-phosphate transport system substrate-binding protein
MTNPDSSFSGLDFTSPVPLYHQLKKSLLQRIVDGAFLPGDRIPTEHEICDTYGVSRTTARQALSILADDGVIDRAPRRGSTVALDWRSTPATRPVRMVLSDAARAKQIETSIEFDGTVDIDVVSYDRIHDHLTRAVSEGEAPDIALIDHVWVAQFADTRMIYPLDELDPVWTNDLVANELHPSIANGYRYEGSMYAVPEEVNLAGIWYDMDVINALAIGVPSTWDELIDLASVIKEAGIVEYPIAMPGGEAAGETTTYCLAAMLASNGVTIIDEAVHLDTPAAVATLRLIRAFVESGLVDPDSISNDWLEGPRRLASQHAAISIGGSYESEHISRYVDLPLSAIGKRFTFAAFPGGPEAHPATAIGGMAHVVFRQSKDPLRAMDVVEAMMRRTAVEVRAVGHWTIPPLQSVVATSSPASPFIAETTAMLPHARTRPIVAGYQPVTRQLQRMVESVISGTLRPAAAAERTAEFIGAITDLAVSRP